MGHIPLHSPYLHRPEQKLVFDLRFLSKPATGPLQPQHPGGGWLCRFWAGAGRNMLAAVETWL